jgi:hypothetical protein
MSMIKNKLLWSIWQVLTIMPRNERLGGIQRDQAAKPGVSDYIQGRGDFDEKMELIMKQNRPMELLRKVREILDR